MPGAPEALSRISPSPARPGAGCGCALRTFAPYPPRASSPPAPPAHRRRPPLPRHTERNQPLMTTRTARGWSSKARIAVSYRGAFESRRRPESGSSRRAATEDFGRRLVRRHSCRDSRARGKFDRRTSSTLVAQYEPAGRLWLRQPRSSFATLSWRAARVRSPHRRRAVGIGRWGASTASREGTISKSSRQAALTPAVPPGVAQASAK